jgi:hypothetical protein
MFFLPDPRRSRSGGDWDKVNITFVTSKVKELQNL